MSYFPIFMWALALVIAMDLHKKRRQTRHDQGGKSTHDFCIRSSFLYQLTRRPDGSSLWVLSMLLWRGKWQHHVGWRVVRKLYNNYTLSTDFPMLYNELRSIKVSLKICWARKQGSCVIRIEIYYAWGFATTRTTRVKSFKLHRIKASMRSKRKTFGTGQKSRQNRDWQKHARTKV